MHTETRHKVPKWFLGSISLEGGWLDSGKGRRVKWRGGRGRTFNNHLETPLRASVAASRAEPVSLLWVRAVVQRLRGDWDGDSGPDTHQRLECPGQEAAASPQLCFHVRAQPHSAPAWAALDAGGILSLISLKVERSRKLTRSGRGKGVSGPAEESPARSDVEATARAGRALFPAPRELRAARPLTRPHVASSQWRAEAGVRVCEALPRLVPSLSQWGKLRFLPVS